MMSLEKKVRREVDSWNISIEKNNGEQVGYIDLVRPLCYGIGIAITEKIIQIVEREATEPGKNYLELPLQEAVREFKKDYLIWHLIQNDCNGRQTALAIGLGNDPESGRTSLAHILKNVGLSRNEIKENAGSYNVEQMRGSSYEDLLDEARTEITRYADCFSRALLRAHIREFAGMIAERFVRIAHESRQIQHINTAHLFALGYNEAMGQFKIEYLKGQLYLSGLNGIEAAQRVGVSHDNFRHHLARCGIKISELKGMQGND